jgi:hypothetical protein
MFVVLLWRISCFNVPGKKCDSKGCGGRTDGLIHISLDSEIFGSKQRPFRNTQRIYKALIHNAKKTYWGGVWKK